MTEHDKYLDALRGVVESLHECKAIHIGNEPVREYFRDEIVWDGRVEVFALTGHPKASTAYGWGYEDGGETKYVTVLEIPPVEDARTAVRVAITSGRA
jgi:hypothetical protein